jgi:hypothetical protein
VLRIEHSQHHFRLKSFSMSATPRRVLHETGLPVLENNVVGVFVHFGEKSAPTWLLMRLPSPEIPSGTVKWPEPKKE